jgi:biotin transport system substrate-specific component
MNQTTTTASPAVLAGNPGFAGKAAIALSASLVVAAAAHISFPLFFTPVPFTLQPLAVIALGLCLGPVVGFSAMALYLIEGASGLPFFTPHGPGGLLQLFGPTGGYLMSYPFVAALAGWLFARSRRSFGAGLVAASVASVLVLACGAGWMEMMTHLAPAKIAAMAVVPFLPGDALKAVVAAGIATGFARMQAHRVEAAE